MDTLTTLLIVIPVLILFRCYLLIVDGIGALVRDKFGAYLAHKSNQRKVLDLYQEELTNRNRRPINFNMCVHSYRSSHCRHKQRIKNYF